MKKLGTLLKKYGFFAATGTICIGALVAIFMLPNKEGNVANEPNPYAKKLTADSQGITDKEPNEGITILEEDDLDTTEETQNPSSTTTTNKEENNVVTNNTQTSEQSTKPATNNVTSDVKTTNTDEDTKAVAQTDNVTSEEVALIDGDELQAETFESTTVSTTDTPFFVDGDTFAWPVEGSVVVPYTDESTRHWFSETLNQTMRTFGICISADAGTQVKAVAKGTVVAADEDSTKLVSENMPNVGNLMVIDHGNGYMSYYGFQNGTMNMDLVGQVVNEGDVLGEVGSPKGAFTSLGDNIYLQIVHNGEVVNPLNYLADQSIQTVKTEGVDMGFAEN